MNTAVARRFRWTAKRYYRLSEHGFFGDKRVELLNGELIEVPAQGQPHRLAIVRTTRLLIPAFGPARYTVVIEGTWVVSRFSAPDPDFHVFEAPEGTPEDRLPIPFLVIEVSDTTYLKDAGPKLRLYASAGVPEYWIVNLPKQQIEVYRGPENPTGRQADCRYATTTIRRVGDSVSPIGCPDLAIPVSEILG